MDVEGGKVTCLSPTGCYENSILCEGEPQTVQTRTGKNEEIIMNDINIFIQVDADREVCVGQPLEKEEATRLALKVRETRHNKVKTIFLYGLTSLEGVQLFFKPLSINDKQLKFITKTYTNGMVYVTYGEEVR